MDATDPPQLAISRLFDAPRAMVFRAFTDPDQLSEWWGPSGSARPRESMDLDVRPGGHQRWVEVSLDDPDVLVDVHIDLADVVDGELLEGVIHVAGRLPGGFAPHSTRFRIELHDAPGGRTRLEVRQWLSDDLVGPNEQGWDESFAQLDAMLDRLRRVAAEVEG